MLFVTVTTKYYLKGINFHEFREFLTITRKLVPAKIIGDCATRETREN